MISHVKQLCESYQHALDGRDKKEYQGVIFSQWPGMIYEEIKDLKTYDFEPSQRYDFVLLRSKFRGLSHKGSLSGDEIPSLKAATRKLSSILDHYARGYEVKISHDFQFMSDKDLREIVIRDYKELYHVLVPDEAWKSAVIISGSILEAVLYDLLSQPRFISGANLSRKAPTDKGVPIPIETGKWRLEKLIEVAVDIQILPQPRAASIDQVLRDYRNFVHPKREIRSMHPCTEAEALMSKGCLDGVCNHLKMFNIQNPSGNP